MLRVATLAVLVAVGTGACSGGQATPAANGSSPTQPAGCAATAAPRAAPSLDVCLSGALSGMLTTVDPETTQCTGDQSGFDGTFVALLDSVETRWEILTPHAAGTFDVNAPSTDLTLNVVQAAKQKTWSSVAEAGRSGTVTLVADRSGVVDVTLPERDQRTGAEVAGAPTLTVRGTFRCPATGA
ncbi:MAG TPA: hypothetical protein VLR26_03095 [Frankiaceae bacterium]|nr:hypothetical protein [Frankiaceae bacterium]